ncbi:hypothetical protein I4U23_014579 [Adineta vaga]|nr:hypothetical protein I4U23_014579 [Adineta vaga]
MIIQRLIIILFLISLLNAYPLDRNVKLYRNRQLRNIDMMNWQSADVLYRQLYLQQNYRKAIDYRTKMYQYPSEFRPVEGPINIEQILAMLASRNVRRYPYSKQNDPSVIKILKVNVMDETIEDNKIEPPLPPITNVVEDSIASRTKEITKRPKRERSPPVSVLPPAPKIKKAKEVAPKLPDKIKWTLEEQKQFFSALRIYGKNFEALGQFFNTRRRNVNPEAQKRTFGQIRCFYYRSFRTVSKLYTFTEEEKANVDSLELRSVLAYLCLKPKVKCFDKKPTITVLHQLIRNGNAFLRVKGQREHVSIIGKALKPPKTVNTLGSSKQTDRTLSKHVKILLSPASSNAYMRVALSCRYPHVEILLSRSTTLHEFMDKLTQYWQLHNHALCLLKDDLSFEQLTLYPHGSYSTSIDSTIVNNDSPDLCSQKQTRSRSDSEHSIEPLVDSSLNPTRKRNNLSENDGPNESISPPATSNKTNLARTAILSAAKRAVSNSNTNNNTNYDGVGFTLIDSAEDEPDSSAGLFKQRLDTIDFTDECASEDEIEPDPNVPTSLSTTVPSTNTNNPFVTLLDLTQGINRINPLFSSLTIGELQKLLQRPKELRLLYDFHNLSHTNSTESPNTFINTKKQQTLRSKCYCSCCAHHQLNSKDQRRPSTKAIHSQNTELSALLQMSQSIPTQEYGELHNKQTSSSKLDEQSDIFDSLVWSADTVTTPLEQSQIPTSSQLSITTSSNPTSTTTTTTELPPLLTLLLPMMNGIESTAPPSQPPPPPPPPVRRPLRYGDQSTRPSNTQLLLDANINAQQTATAVNHRLTFNDLNISTTQNNPFRSDCENPMTYHTIQFIFLYLDDLLNDNSNLSSVSLSTTIVNAALQSNTSRLRLDWPDNMSDLSFGSFPDLLDSNLSSGELMNFEQSTTTEQNKCASENSMSDALFAINNTTNLLLQN